jgi:hypothetical protein
VGTGVEYIQYFGLFTGVVGEYISLFLKLRRKELSIQGSILCGSWEYYWASSFSITFYKETKIELHRSIGCIRSDFWMPAILHYYSPPKSMRTCISVSKAIDIRTCYFSSVIGVLSTSLTFISSPKPSFFFLFCSLSSWPVNKELLDPTNCLAIFSFYKLFSDSSTVLNLQG